jgi:hypothetical protein
MTAFDLIQQYIREHDDNLPPVGMEYVEVNAYANRICVDTPEADSIIAVCQMLRQRQAEALREAGQMVLL